MKKIFVILAVFAAAVSCGKQGSTTDSSAPLTPLTFTALTDGATKTSLAPNGRGILWSTADEINVFSGTSFGTNTKFTVTSTEADGTIATFEGLGAVSPEYYALSPYQAGANIDGSGVITATLPADQNTSEGTFSPEANLSVAHIAGTEDLKFKNVGALLSVKIEAEGVTSVKLESLDHTALTGTATINYNGGEPTATVTSGNDYVQSTVSGTGSYYFVAYPGTHASGFKVTVTRPGYTASISKSTPLVLKRNNNVLMFTIPADIEWQPVFTPGEKVYIKGLSDPNENGQQVSYIPADYYAPRAGGVAPVSPAPGDESALSGITYNYEVWARIDENDEVYFESESGTRFAVNVAVDAVAHIAPDGVGPRISVSNSPYRIRINLPSGDAQIVRVGLVNWGIIYGSQGVGVNLDYDKAGAWKVDNYSFKHDYQSWDANLSRYRFSIWFNWFGGQGGSNFDLWQRYGTCTLNNNLGTTPSTADPAEEYYYVQPFSGDGWDTIFYMPDWLFIGWENDTKKGTINLYMNNTYGHFTHGYSNVVDNN